MRIHIVFIVALLFGLSGCNRQPSDNTFTMSIDPTKVTFVGLEDFCRDIETVRFHASDTLLIGGISNLVWDQDRYFVLDNMTKSFFIFSANLPLSCILIGNIGRRIFFIFFQCRRRIGAWNFYPYSLFLFKYLRCCRSAEGKKAREFSRAFLCHNSDFCVLVGFILAASERRLCLLFGRSRRRFL